MKARSNRPNKFYGIDPKPGELPMGRVSPAEMREEARTRYRCKGMGRPVGRGDMPIEPGDSWFSPKYI